MKRTSAFIIMAAALLLTQCRKPSIEFPTPSVTTTVSMTVTAGPGSKTDINGITGAITWSSGDKLYVGDGSKYIGYLILTSGAGKVTGTFSGNVTLTGTGEKTFHFYYLGSTAVPTANATEVTVDFSSQEIYANGGKLINASKYHVGYGSAKGTVSGGVVTGINVILVSKVALAWFSFKKDDTNYTGALTLSGEHIYNKMTVNFNASDFSFTPVKDGAIRLTNTTTHLKYAMLVPTGLTEEEILNFGGGDAAGSTTLANGIEANKFYRVDSSMPIVVTVKPFEFTVSSGKTVKFSKGNLYWDGSAFRFEANQWSFADTWNASHVSHFFWSNTTDWQVSGKEPYAASYSYSTFTGEDVFFTNGTHTTANSKFQVKGETTGTWRTLSKDEWDYLLNTSNASSGARTDANRFAKAKVNGVKGLLIFPDGYNGGAVISATTGVAALNTKNAEYPFQSIPDATWTSMESLGAVFLPAAGNREGTGVVNVGTHGYYCSSALESKYFAFGMCFYTDYVGAENHDRYFGSAVRLVR